MRGSRRNHAICRRARLRVRLTVCWTASSRLSSLLQVAGELSVADGLCGGEPAAEPARRPASRTSSSHPAAEHLLDTTARPWPRDAPASSRTPAARTRFGRIRLPRRREGAERLPGDRRDLEGADDPPDVPRLDLRGGHRIHLGQAPVHGFRSQNRGFSLQRAADPGVGPRELQVVHDRPEVQTRATDEQPPRPARRTSFAASRAAAWNAATLNASLGSARSSRWCGTRARCSAVGLAVPTSMPR